MGEYLRTTRELLERFGLSECAPPRAMLSVAGARVWEIGDLWMVQSLLTAGTEVEIEYIRNGQVRSGKGVLAGFGGF